MATTHPSDDYMNATWMEVSESFDWSRDLDHPAVHTELRLAVIGEVLDSPIFSSDEEPIILLVTIVAVLHQLGE